MQHFLEISQLSRPKIEALIQRAISFKKTQSFPQYQDQIVANLFYENSTRTRVSFELGAKHLGMKVINLDLQTSSEAKGEIIEDTVKTLAAMGIQHFVVRHKENGLQQQLAATLGNQVHFINAGDGSHAHPSQAILDMMTIVEQKPKLEKLDQLKIAVLGNVKHSRVANSFQCICKALGVGELVLIAPDVWQPEKTNYGTMTNNLKEGLQDADVVMCLRVQKERLLEDDHIDLECYRRDFALTQNTLKFAKPDAMVMHPGPMNRGVEIDSDVADGKQSYILEQVTNGVYARMAIFDALI